MQKLNTNRNSGFTLIELAVVIIILGILAVVALPKFINLSQDAEVSTVKATGGAFSEGITLANVKWATLGKSGPADNLQIFPNAGTDGQLDINQWGFPAQNWPPFEASPRLDNENDCMSVWETVLQDAPSISDTAAPEDTLYLATYINPDQCRYFYNPLPALSIYYDSRNGQVITDSDPNS